MPPTKANPGAGGTRVHGISKSDAASPSLNHNPAQTNPAARSATFVLAAADELNIKVGTDGVDVITISTRLVPLEVGRWIHGELAKNKRAVIAAIQRENAARTGAMS